MNRGLSGSLLVVLFLASSPVARGQEAAVSSELDGPDEVLFLLDSWQVGLAETRLRELGDVRDERLDYARVRIHYARGDYKKAELVLDGVRRPERFAPYDTLVPAALGQRSDVVEERSKHFVVRVKPGPDELLIPYALETLEQAWQLIGEDLDHFPEGPIVLEIFPDRSSFTELSTLSKEEVTRTGTIALCKWDHLLAISPRALATGYDWRDTLAHEYVHLLESRLSWNRAPVWFQEGTAAFLAERWRKGRGGTLTPVGESLLAQARGTDRFVTFEQMHPSMAKLPDAASASLAFAEVTTAIEFLVRSGGVEGIRKSLDLMASGLDAREAVARIHGSSFGAWEREWKRWLDQLPLRERLDVGAMGVLFSEDDVESEGPSDPILKGDDKASGHARLGDLLRERGRQDAAIVEYKKAQDGLEHHSPALANRFAQTLMEMGRHTEARDVLEVSADLIPTYAHSWVRLATTYAELELEELHLNALRTARDLNPFDPRVHRAILAAPDRTQAEAHASERALSVLTVRERKREHP